MKTFINLLVIFCCAVAQGGFVYQNGRDFFTTADLDGDSRQDLVLVIGSNATVRVGYQTTAGSVTWSAPRALAMDDVSGIACGNILNKPYDVLLATTPLINRVNLYQLNSAASAATPRAIFIDAVGPQSLAAIDIGGTGNTANDDIFAYSVLNGSGTDAYGATMIRSDGTNQSLISTIDAGAPLANIHAVEYKSGATNALAFTARITTENFYLDTLSTAGYNLLTMTNMVSSNSEQFLSFIPSSTNLAEFVFWQPGYSQLETFRITEPSPGSFRFANHHIYDLGTPVTSIFTVQAAGETKLAVVFTNGAASVYSYDGTTAPALLQNLATPAGRKYVGILPLGANDFITVASVDGTLAGGDLLVGKMHYNGSRFSPAGTNLLAQAEVKSHANVMTFKYEPFVNSMPRRLQLLQAGDWAANSKISAGFVQSIAYSDRGTTQGLGSPQPTVAGSAVPAAAYTMDNRITNCASSCSQEPARGAEVATIAIDPSPGMYGRSVDVSFSVIPTNATVYYRTDADSAWSTYTAPFSIFKNTTIHYFAISGSSNSIIREARYTFTAQPDEIDSDGDGVPDYVELANGLDPAASGMDADGDGASDLDELINGTDPQDSSSMPTSHINQASLFDLAVTPYPYDGKSDAVELSRAGTALKTFSAAGGLFSFAVTTNLSLTLTITNPAALFGGLSRDVSPHFMTIVSEQRFDTSSGSAGNQFGVELIGTTLLPDNTNFVVNYTYQGGDLATEADNWLTAAAVTYSNRSSVILVEPLTIQDTLSSILIERKLADLLYQRGLITNRWCSLFKGRTADISMDGLDADDIAQLERGDTNTAAYSISCLITNIRAAAANAGNLLALTTNIYDICSYYGAMTNNLGKYPLPADVLRNFIYDGTLQSNYLAITSLSASELTNAYTEAQQILSGVPARPTVHLTLTVATNSFDGACPVLYSSGGSAYSLYNAKGRAYRFPETFVLSAGAEVSLAAYSDLTKNDCPGTVPLEVITLDLTAIPTASGRDSDGNLLPDEYEAMLLAGGGHSATNDSDGDGYCDLQEYLDGSDPMNPASHGNVPVSLEPPVVTLKSVGAAGFAFSIDWPAGYASPFVFTIEYTDDLGGTPFSETAELPQGSLSTTISGTGVNTRFYRARMRLR